VRPDGSILWCVDRGRLVQVEEGMPPRLSGILVDITERKRREAQVRALDTALARSAEELQAVLDVLPVGIFIADDASCSVIRSNPAGAAMLGIGPNVNVSATRPGAEALPFRVLRDGVEVSPDGLAMQRSARLGAPVRDDELVVERQDGATTIITIDAVPLFDGDARVRGCVGAFIDITERKLAERARDEEARRKDEFLATLAHELRNPLAPIRTAVEVLRLAGEVDHRQANALDVIARQAEQLGRLVDDLLDVSRITRGKVELRKAWVEVATIVARALETSGPALRAAGHDVHVDVPEGLRVWGDLTRLAQIVDNLLSNAAKYTGSGGNVWIEAARRGSEISVGRAGGRRRIAGAAETRASTTTWSSRYRPT
jgi:signal transduction histidine kinase